MHDPILQARMMVMEAVNEYREPTDHVVLEDVYVVWYNYTLSNWKALVSTTIPDDRYYEVTHKAGGETFVDVYVKERQRVVPLDDPVHNL
jgi:hypothetical protein